MKINHGYGDNMMEGIGVGCICKEASYKSFILFYLSTKFGLKNVSLPAWKLYRIMLKICEVTVAFSHGLRKSFQLKLYKCESVI